MAWTSMIVEPGLCLTGLAPYAIEQDPEKWVMTGEYRTGVLDVMAPCVTGCKLYIEGCETFGGQWSQIAALTTKTSTRYFLRRSAPMGSPERLPKYIRWRIDSDGVVDPGAWTASARILLSLKD